MQRNWNSHILLVGMQKDIATSENILAISYEIKYTLTIRPSNITPGDLSQTNENICPHKDLYPDVHSSFIHNSSKWETTQIFMNLSIDKQIAGILLSKLKVQNIGTCNNVRGPQKYYAK